MEVVRRTRLPVLLAAIVAAGVIGLAGPRGLRASDPPWSPAPCPPGTPSPSSSGPGAWFSLDPVLDATGTLAARRLTLGRVGGAVRQFDLPPESFASGPVGGRVLVGDDDATRSQLRLVDAAAGCALTLGTQAAVVRGAILAPDGRTTWEHRVDRATRADLGIWQRSVAGGPARLVLPGLPVDPSFGPTWETTLDWADDARLIVGSCGSTACRVRVLDPWTGRIERVDGSGQVIGIAAGQVVAYAACPSLPCPIEAIDLASGRRTTLASGWGFAALGGPRGRTLAFEDARGLAALDVVTGRPVTLPAGVPSLPVRGGSTATSGAELPAGWLLLAPAGHLGDPAAARGLDPASGTTHDLPEVTQ